MASLSLRRLIPFGVIGLAAVLAGLAQSGEADDQYAVAAGHYAQQRWSLAADEFQLFLKSYPADPKSPEARFFLGESLLQLRQLKQSEPHFREYLRLQPGGRFARPALFRVGETAFLSGRAAEAKTSLQHFTERFPDDKLNAYALVYLGDLAFSSGAVVDACKHYQDALERFPQGSLQDDCRLGLGRALEKLGRNDEAERMYLALAGKTASQLAPQAQLHMATLLYNRERYAEASEAFKAFERRWPKDPRQAEAVLGRGWCLYRDRRFAEAESLFQSLIDHPSAGITARYWLGLTQKAKENFPAAAKTLLTAATEAPKDHPLQPALRFQAGDALLRAGDLAGAARLLDQVWAAAPDPWADDAARGRIQTALKAEDWAAVDRLAEKFFATFPQSDLKPDVQRLLGRSLLERKHHGRAAEILESLVASESTATHPSTTADRTLPAAGPLLAPDEAAQQRLEDRYLLALAYEGMQRYEDALATVLPVVDQACGRLKLDALLVKGSLLVATRRYAEAIDPLKSCLADHVPGDGAVRARAGLAICLARTGHLDQAKSNFKQLVAEKPKPELIEAATEQLSEAAYEAGDAAWAAELFARLARATPAAQQELKALSGLAWSQRKANQLQEAADSFERLLRKNPPPELLAEAAFARGQILEQLGQADGALATYDQVIQRCVKSEEHPQALLAAARLHAKLEQPRQSVDLLNRLLREYPSLPQLDGVLYELAWTLRDLGQRDEAAAQLVRLHDAHSESRYWADATYRLAQQAFEAKDYARAEKLLTEVLDRKVGAELRPHALFLRGQLAAVAQQWDQVQTTFKQLRSEYPSSTLIAAAEYWIAEALFRKGDYAAAGERLDRLAPQLAENRESWVPMVPLRRAQILAHLGHWQDAYQIASKIERQYPDFPQQYEVDYLLGRCLADRADFDEAREAYLRVIRSPQGSKTETAAMAQWMSGESYFHQKNYQAALREYLRLEILYAYPKWQALALLQAGKCHELLGQWKEATQLYDRVLKTYHDSPSAAEAARRLETTRQRTTAQASSQTRSTQ